MYDNLPFLTPGGGYPRGMIHREIIKYILKFPTGIPETIIREYLTRDFKIINQKTVKTHLETLRIENLIEKEGQSGKTNVWITKKGPEFSKYLIKNLLNVPSTSENEHEIGEIFYSAGTKKYIEDIKDGLSPPNLSTTIGEPDKSDLLFVYRKALTHSPSLVIHSVVPQSMIYFSTSLLLQRMFQRNELSSDFLEKSFTINQIKTLPVLLSIISALNIDSFRYNRSDTIQIFFEDNATYFSHLNLREMVLDVTWIQQWQHDVSTPDGFLSRLQYYGKFKDGK